MDAAMYLSSVFGPFMTIIGAWMLLHPENFMMVWRGIKNSPSMLYHSSALNLLIGFLVLSQYDFWTWTPFIWVTLLGWVMIVRGLLGLFAPQLLMKIFLKHAKVTRFVGVIPLVWGLILSWIGFF